MVLLGLGTHSAVAETLSLQVTRHTDNTPFTYSIQDGVSGEPALFRSDNGVDSELIDGIEQMQIRYGIDTTDDDHPNQYVTSDDVPDMNDVMAVRIMLLVRSVNEFVVEAPQALDYNDTNFTAGDRRLRQVFSTTITLRNRIGGI